MVKSMVYKTFKSLLATHPKASELTTADATAYVRSFINVKLNKGVSDEKI